ATQAGKADAGYQFHALDFLNYAYLQNGQAAKAQDVINQLKSVPGASPDELANETAWLTARTALELHDWKSAAAVSAPNGKPGSADSIYFVRAIGAARNGDAAAS